MRLAGDVKFSIVSIKLIFGGMASNDAGNFLGEGDKFERIQDGFLWHTAVDGEDNDLLVNMIERRILVTSVTSESLKSRLTNREPIRW
jgi:hypothetical protein